ncbi:MAG: adenosylhopane nucleosidase [Paracoccaceae bacterium]
MVEIGIICGMVSEVRTLGRWVNDARVSVMVSGARPDKAEQMTQRLADAGARLLVSWGIAGGLDPALASGALVSAESVTTPDLSTYPLATKLLGSTSDGLLVGSDVVVTSVAEKASLRARTGALAVDMETHKVAEVAAARALPCLAVRAISDPADRALPVLAASALNEDGRPRIGRVIKGLVRQPWELPCLVAAGRDSNRALATLRAAADDIFCKLLNDAGGS